MHAAIRLARAARRRVALGVEPLEHRTLLSGTSGASPAIGSRGVPAVQIGVPGTYISQQSSALDVTLERINRPALRRSAGPLTVEFTAAPGTLTGGAPSTTGLPFTPIDEVVTFPAGQSTETVTVPITVGAPNPGLVPITLMVSPQNGGGAKSSTTVFLVRGPDAIPPAIIAVHLVKRGIAVTFSKAMASAAVQDVHNYAVQHTPSQEFSLVDLTGAGLIQRLNNTAAPVALRRAVYDASTRTVTLIPKVALPSSGSYEISSPASLGSKRPRRHQAQPLADLQGSVLNPGGAPVAGAFSISIRRGHPYTASAPALSDGQPGEAD